MARVVSAEPAGLAAGIATAEASFVAVLAADAKHILSEPAPICLSGYDTLRQQVLSSRQTQHRGGGGFCDGPCSLGGAGELGVTGLAAASVGPAAGIVAGATGLAVDLMAEAIGFAVSGVGVETL
ncbi:hypothetical protein TIFTF001_047220 [Ficus carica]|uniref:Uncharacterized protein n=1 Tax=Ficus carica TaxID=3494 RepID=A0AA88CLK6_FICCA|nr:hypothetical protein TIFTF001_047210 [Ficus carica]GMN21050.1 hypothetical protein TIFTF001_047214 [Ficus carica]GMN21057.1 hypothetical protein TIFTF001_047216 [Ficus carica]GMN21081.1 hypothetical protein TIFTF001_047220 [Ficus carica]